MNNTSKKKIYNNNMGLKKIPSGKNIVITREKFDEIRKCGKDPIYFINHYVMIQHPTKGLIKFSTYEFQNQCVKDFTENRFSIVLKSRQLGLSTITAAYC